MELIKPDLGVVFWTGLAFLIVLFILKRWAWEPILNALEAREKRITEALAAAEKAEARARELEKKLEEERKKAAEEHASILREAQQQAQRIIEEARKKAQEEGARMIEEAQRQIKLYEEQAKARLQMEAARLAIEIAERILGEELSDREKYEKFVLRTINKLVRT